MSQSYRKSCVIWFGIEGNSWEEEESSKRAGAANFADDSSRDFKSCRVRKEICSYPLRKTPLSSSGRV
jgi:hypothetical protein